MKFVTIRDFRSKSAEIQRNLPKYKEMVLTSNGKPIAILAAVSEDNVEEMLTTIHRAKAIEAVTSMQKRSTRTGAGKLTMREIDREIAALRRARERP